MKRGLFLVQLPPPVHGVSAMNDRVVNDLGVQASVDVDVLRIAYTRELSEINKATVAKFGHWVQLLLRLLYRLSKKRPDFVYFTPVPTGRGYVRDLPFILLVKAFRVPLILHLHGRGIAEQASSAAWRRLYRVGLSGCAIVSASPAMQARELVPLGLHDSRLYVVPNTVARIDPHVVSPRRCRPAPRLLFLSSTFPFKGIFVLLESVRRLQQRGVEFDLDIVGASTPEHDARIREFISQHALRRVRVLGALYGAEKYAALGDADVLVHPTLNDYSPLVILEAMQCGLAIVSTRIGAIPEMVEDGVHGTLVAPNDVDALARAIEGLIHAPHLIRRMGALSKCRYARHYSPERFRAALLDVIESETRG